ncbi:MAG: L-serine ammonia-lyase, iron-sulfur-dependent, subunit alpha [Thermoanaerobaculales bacterium]|jgi:L-serine dehydratase|nr:L-serine ammonia-lyase, iron-sulfur-dependent, subunit alpha [Thermoanaerobaculales bacterium]
MAFISIFNDVIGPVMRGPSSSHTAGAHRIGLVVRDLLGAEPRDVRVTFDPKGSMAPTWESLGVDLALAAGLMGWTMLDEKYVSSVERMRAAGSAIDVDIAPLEETDHPNGMLVEILPREGERLRVIAEAVGGGGIRITSVNGRPVEIDGKSRVELVEDGLPTRKVRPVFFVRRAEAVFESGKEMVAVSEARGLSLGEAALAYEAELLGFTEVEVVDEMLRRLEVMERSAAAGLDDGRSDMLLLEPTALKILTAEESGAVAVGGIHTRAAARAMAVMHHCNSRGVVCAAPTGGSAGVVPGVILSLAEEMGLPRRRAVLALFAAGAVGLIVARRATFAAEIAGCQVEIGVAGAMAAAAVVEAAGGGPRQAADAAAVSLQNTLGSPCDPVAGACEVPCHTRNAVAASSAFTCADLVLGGYVNPIPLDEAIDVSYEVGKALPAELRCTARGGCAVAPSALALRPRR